MLWWLFNKEEPPRKSLIRHCIHEVTGPVYLDDDYVELGTNGGWLIFTGWHKDEYGNDVYTYRLRG